MLTALLIRSCRRLLAAAISIINADKLMPFALSHFFFRLIIIAAFTFNSIAHANEPILPGGANTLHEAHGDWTVNCAIQTQHDGSKTKFCVFSQQQIAEATRQRALAIELQPDGDGMKGSLLLPFGLALGAGVTLQLDEGEVGAPQAFRTCLPIGCLIDLAFNSPFLKNLEAGRILKVNATADTHDGNGQHMTFSISLTGFSSAYHRVVALTE